MLNVCMNSGAGRKCAECGSHKSVKIVHFHGQVREVFFQPMCEKCFRKMVPPDMVAMYDMFLNSDAEVKF